MKLRIWDDSFEQAPETELNLRLVPDGERISVVAVDETGKTISCGYLIGFNRDGSIVRHRGVNKSLGLSLEPEGNMIREAHIGGGR